MRHFLTCVIPTLLFLAAVLSVYLLEIRLWLKAVRGKSARDLNRPAAWCLHIAAAAGLACAAWGYFVEPYRLEVVHVPIQTDKLQTARLRIVQISDLHCDRRVRLENTLPEVVNALNPDLIVFTGDAVNTRRALPLFQNTLSRMHAPLGQYGITGNNDIPFCKNVDIFENSGFTELRLDAVRLEKDGERFGLCGIDFMEAQNSIRALRQLDPDRFNILLYHNSNLVDYIADKPVDLYLSGHTHGGQVALPFYGALMTQSQHGKKYEAGLYNVGPVRFYVNRGIGMCGGLAPRVRFLARPEITVFDIIPREGN